MMRLKSCFLILITNVTKIYSFIPASTADIQHRATTTSNLAAIIYGEDGSVMLDDENEQKQPENFFGEKVITTDQHDIMLNQDQLVQIGCAFAPPPHNTLHPQRVLNAEMVKFSSNGIEIALAVKDESLHSSVVVQILVPVPLPSSSEEDLQSLCQTAQEIIQSREWDLEHEDELNEIQKQVISLEEEAYGDELPLWWTFANLNFVMEEEATLLKNLLNQNDLSHNVLFFFERRTNTSIDVKNARVASIGPSGIIVRALCIDDETTRTETLAVQFEQEAKSSEDLRKYVLELMEEGEDEEDEEEIVDNVGSTMAKEEEMSTSLLPEDEISLDIKGKEEQFQRRLLAARLKYEKKAHELMHVEASSLDEHGFVLDRFGVHRRSW